MQSLQLTVIYNVIFVRVHLTPVLQATVAKCHQLGMLNNRKWAAHHFRGWKSRIKVATWWISDLPPWLTGNYRPCVSFHGLSSEDACLCISSQWIKMPLRWPHFNLITFLKILCSIMVTYWDLESWDFSIGFLSNNFGSDNQCVREWLRLTGLFSKGFRSFVIFSQST